MFEEAVCGGSLGREAAGEAVEEQKASCFIVLCSTSSFSFHALVVRNLQHGLPFRFVVWLCGCGRSTEQAARRRAL